MIMIAISTFGVSMASFIIGAQYWNVTCDTTSFMSLPTWVVTIATVAAICCIVAIITYVIRRFKKHDEDSGFLILIVLTVIATLIVIVFNGMGSHILFNHSSSCYTEAYSLWGVALTALIFQWCIIVVGVMVIIGLCVAMYKSCKSART